MKKLIWLPMKVEKKLFPSLLACQLFQLVFDCINLLALLTMITQDLNNANFFLINFIIFLIHEINK